MNIFFSRLNAVDDNQKNINKLEELLLERGLKPRTIGATDFPNVSPMKVIKNVMRECSGAVILGYRLIIESYYNKYIFES